MNLSFLNGLIGLTESVAVAAVEAVGLTVHVLPPNAAVAAAAVPKTVYLSVKDGVVVRADEGDPFEIVDDVSPSASVELTENEAVEIFEWHDSALIDFNADPVLSRSVIKKVMAAFPSLQEETEGDDNGQG
jgi:hypothetical protein